MSKQTTRIQVIQRPAFLPFGILKPGPLAEQKLFPIFDATPSFTLSPIQTSAPSIFHAT